MHTLFVGATYFLSILADPYLNTDAGTMSPFEHGEVFVLDDGGEVPSTLPINLVSSMLAFFEPCNALYVSYGHCEYLFLLKKSQLQSYFRLYKFSYLVIP